MIDNSRLVLYNNEIVKVSLFSRKGAKEYHGSKEEITYLCRIKSTWRGVRESEVVKRKEVAAKIKEAREQGDLSENAEYDAAKDEQRDIEARIEELEAILKNAEVVVEDEVDLIRLT